MKVSMGLVIVVAAIGFCITVRAVPQAGDPICAKNSTTLRKGPGPQFAVSWKAPRFMPFLRFEGKNGWVRVQDLDGEIHWAVAKDLSRNLRCVVVKSQVATLRKDPFPTAKQADMKTIDKYTAMKRLESEGEWIHVEDEAGHQSWINETNVWKPVRVTKVNF